MKERDLDKLFREELQDFEATPPSDAFNEIMLRIAYTRRRTLVALLFILTAFGVDFYSLRHPNATPVVPQANFENDKDSSPKKELSISNATTNASITENKSQRQVSIVAPNSSFLPQAKKHFFEPKKNLVQTKKSTQNPYTNLNTTSLKQKGDASTSAPISYSENQFNESNSISKEQQDKNSIASMASFQPLEYNLSPFEIVVVESVKRRRYVSDLRDNRLFVSASFSSGAALIVAPQQSDGMRTYDFGSEASLFQSFRLKIERQFSRRWYFGLAISQTNIGWRQSVQSQNIYPTYQVSWTGNDYEVVPVFEQNRYRLSQNVSLQSGELGFRYLLSVHNRFNYSLTGSALYWRWMGEKKAQKGLAAQVGFDVNYVLSARASLVTGIFSHYHFGNTTSFPVSTPSSLVGIRLGCSWRVR